MEQNLKRLAIELESVGISPEVSNAVSYGVYFKALLYCWNNMTDVLGTSFDIDAIVGEIGLPEGMLCSKLRAAGLIKLDGGLFYLKYVVQNANDTVRKRWYRNDKDSYIRARDRGMSDRRKRKEIEKPKTETNLFGETIYLDKPDSKKKKGNTEHARLVKYWCDQWQEKYGIKYPFTATDAKHIQRLLACAEKYSIACDCIKAYLSNKEQFYKSKSHKLGALVGDMPKFLKKQSPEDSGGYPIL